MISVFAGCLANHDRAHSQYENVDWKIGYEILEKDTWGSLCKWSQQDLHLVTTILEMTHGMAGYGMTPNVITHISSKVVMVSHFLVFVGSTHRNAKSS